MAAKLQAQKLVEASAPAPIKTVASPASEPQQQAEKGGLGKMLAKMMENPDTRKLLQEQQRMMMDQMYGPLVEQIGLTPEEAAQFKDMLVENAMKATEKASSLFGGDAGTNRADLFGSLRPPSRRASTTKSRHSWEMPDMPNTKTTRKPRANECCSTSSSSRPAVIGI